MDRIRIYSWYAQYKDGIYRYALSILKDPHLAEDALQETFLRLLSGKSVVEPGKEQAWLYRVARNYCFDLLRRQKRQQEPPRPEGQEEHYRYIDMIACLDPRDQEIVTLKVIEGMTCKDIGKVIGMTAPGVQKRYERAMKKLREQEENYGT